MSESENSKKPIDIIDTSIELSSTTTSLLEALKAIKTPPQADEYSKMTVSQTVSVLALAYEKIRNAIEYREDHLIRRAAIERILKRRLALDPEGKNESENLLRELMWARYFPNGSLGQPDIQNVQKIIDAYIDIKKKVLTGRPAKSRKFIAEYLMHLTTAEIEETLSPVDSEREADLTYFIFQVLKKKIKIEGQEEAKTDTELLIAIEKIYRKSDKAYQSYHLFRLFYKPLAQYEGLEREDLIGKFASICDRIDELINSSNVEKLVRFTRKQLPPFLILFSLIEKNKGELNGILTDKKALWTKIEQISREKYAQVKKRLNTLAFRSLIYIFLTKMVFAIVLEVPISQYLYNEVSYQAIAINSIFPPLLMLFIILTVSVPGADNTKRLFFRIVDIIDADNSFETSVAMITKKAKKKRPLLSFGFGVLYFSTFFVTLYLIHLGLKQIHFNILSEALFIFFVSVVAFFAYRIKEIANMYRLTEKEGVFSPIVDFFYMPILSLGKFFSEGVSKINFFILIFDFIIEAPFKLIIEVIEEWITFVKNKKEDMV